MLPFSQHTALLQQYENFTGGGTSLATLLFVAVNLKVPCTHTEVSGESQLVVGGFSPGTMLERCEARISLFNGYVPLKGHLCNLQVNPTAPVIALQVASVNIEPGGEVYRFQLVDANYKA